MNSDFDSVFATFENTRRSLPHAPFLHVPANCPGGPLDLSYDQAGLAISKLRDVYRNAGYTRGHHVGLLLENRASFFLHWIALNALGATVVPLGADATPAETAYILEFGDVDLVVHLSERQSQAAMAAQSVPALQLVSADAFDGAIPAAAQPKAAGPQPDSAAIVFTSGSTGRPKGCVLSNEYFLTFGRWYRDLGGRCTLRYGQERLITPLPLNHVNALAFSSMGMIFTGGCVIQLDRFHSTYWWETVRRAGATVMHYLGVMPAMLLQLPSRSDDQAHNLRFGFGGGVRSAHHRAFEDRFAVPLIEAWAMTETGGAGTIATNLGPRHIGSGCIGRPAAAYSEATIVGDDGGETPPGTPGELVVRATGTDPRRGFFAGYYKDPAATSTVWSGGWLHTGDVAVRDAEGSIFFVGRRKQIIRRSGENISAAEVEAVLSADDAVRHVAVIPVPDDIREEEVCAVVVPHDGVEPSISLATSMIERAARQLSFFKLPGYVAFADSIPVTATQKPRYSTVIDLVTTLIAQQAPTVFDLRQLKRKFRISN